MTSRFATPSTSAIRRDRARQLTDYQAARSIVTRCCYAPIERVDGKFRCSLCEREVNPSTGKDAG